MSIKPIRISSHAFFEMRRRGISRGQVSAVIRNPGQVLASIKGRQIFQNVVGRARRLLLLRVIVKEDAQAYHVVTAYKTSKIAKYWRTP